MESVTLDALIREFTQRQEYDYDYVNGRIKLQTQHYFTGIPFNPFMPEEFSKMK